MVRLIFLRLLPLAILIWSIRGGARHGAVFGRMLLDLASGSMARMEVGAIARAVSAECADGPLTISPRDFESWLRDNLGTAEGSTRPVHLDRFGSPYDLVVDGRHAMVRSRGPDRRADTDDDRYAQVRCGE